MLLYVFYNIITYLDFKKNLPFLLIAIIPHYHIIRITPSIVRVSKISTVKK